MNNKLSKLLNEYKSIAKEMKTEAKNYKRLSQALRTPGHAKDTYTKYRESWKKLLDLDTQAYNIMCEYRNTSESFGYRILFAFGILPKQNGYRYYSEEYRKQCFKYNFLINMI